MNDLGIAYDRMIHDQSMTCASWTRFLDGPSLRTQCRLDCLMMPQQPDKVVSLAASSSVSPSPGLLTPGRPAWIPRDTPAPSGRRWTPRELPGVLSLDIWRLGAGTMKANYELRITRVGLN